jgi:predicted glutamine amidotransferase
MCELLGMSANVPTDICFSWAGMIPRGGETGPHKDGWGIAFYEGKGLREFRDPVPSCSSEIAQFVRNFPIKSHVVISHIRQANVGEVCLENTHPFIREYAGMYWCFAHNGQLTSYKDLPTKRFQPVGSTDSEHAFCWLMDAIADECFDPVDYQCLGKLLYQRCSLLRERGVFNMLLSNSYFLFAFCGSKLHWITRQAPFGKAELADEEMTIDFTEHTTPNDRVTVIATAPLTVDENWQTMAEGELLVFKDGAVMADLMTSSTG